MRKTVLTIIAGLLFFAGSSCSGFGFRDRKEGPDGDVFRVYVRIDTLDIPETMTDEELDAKLLAECGLRFRKMWLGVSSNPVLSQEQNFPSRADAILKSGKLRYRKEREEYAEAFADYALDKDTADKIKKAFPDPVVRDKDDDE